MSVQCVWGGKGLLGASKLLQGAVMSRALSLVPARVPRRCHWLDFRVSAMMSWLLIGRRPSDLAGWILLLAGKAGRREEKGG